MAEKKKTCAASGGGFVPLKDLAMILRCSPQWALVEAKRLGGAVKINRRWFVSLTACGRDMLERIKNYDQMEKCKK